MSKRQIPDRVEGSAGRVTPQQVRDARKLLGWSREKLSQMCGVSVGILGNFEHGFTGASLTPERFAALRAALEAAGIIFTNGEEPGVKLRKPDVEGA